MALIKSLTVRESIFFIINRKKIRNSLKFRNYERGILIFIFVKKVLSEN